MKTRVINLIGGPGSGKSTLAAGLFARLKLAGQSAELVAEYAKTWAWAGKRITQDDELYLLAKQCHHEQRLYGKVKYLITDAALEKTAAYEMFYYGKILTGDYVKHHRARWADRVEVLDFFVTRQKTFIGDGRFESTEQAALIDKFLGDTMIHYYDRAPYLIDAHPRQQPSQVLEILHG